MPTAIAVTSPDLALPPTDRQTPAAVVLQAPHLQSLDDALTETSAVLEHHGHLIVLYSSACPPEHIRRMHTLRAVLESDRIAIVPLPLPPLGVALLARQLRQLSLCDFSPGVLAGAARLLTHYLHTGALLGSVSGLDRIEVDLRSHVKSWLPGAHFAVLAHPEPQLFHVDRHSTEAGLPAPGFATQLTVARGQLTSDWVTGTLAPAWRVQGVYEARLPAESARWWGTQKLIEFAAAIPDVSVLRQLVASVRREECGWCGLELLGDHCAFCAAPLARERAAGGGGSGQGPAAIGGSEHRPGGGTEAAARALGVASSETAAPVSATAAASGSVPAADSASVSAPAPASGPAPVPGPAPAPAPSSGGPGESAAPSDPAAGQPLSPVTPPGAAGVAGVLGVPGATGVRGGGRPGEPGPGQGQWDVRGPDLTAGSSDGSGNPYASGNPYGSGRPVPGNPYASDGARAPGPSAPGPSAPGPSAPGHWNLPGHPDFTSHSEQHHPQHPGYPDPAGRPETPGTPRTVARVR
ncbi:hypothetical protein RM550_23165 [Streptomyces sp. DSM 41527]|uniref:Uncharacterized protein n=1 Tax=Streptomyces mooreae TaxID=3075523 RepID=A0ABU2TCC9_9ACTN|nr:hypothetical protein [Streptomyces sp. DSM 41527]MDT0458599.1 hypothetical protein [Streptomyces sp. DSM 41527]